MRRLLCNPHLEAIDIIPDLLFGKDETCQRLFPEDFYRPLLVERRTIMGCVRVRKETGTLYLDFYWAGKRFREQTKLKDNPTNRASLNRTMKKIDKAIKDGTFVYADFFTPKVMLNGMSRAVMRTQGMTKAAGQHNTAGHSVIRVLFCDFAEEFFFENEILWKKSYKKTVRGTLDAYLIPMFGHQLISQIQKGDILKFRAQLAKEGKKGRALSNDRINHIMTPLRMIMAEAAERFGIPDPLARYKPLPVSRKSVEPFSLEEVKLFLEKVRGDFRNYYAVRFFTAMRTGEIDGLKWEYVDFDRREIRVEETIVDGEEESPKTNGSVRTISMSYPVLEALKRQYEETGQGGGYVFLNKNGCPLDHRNVTKRIWYPTLERLGLKKRTPYQTRHTAATLWLAAGENPEWIARQMGHTTTRMLFTVYSRFVPNLTRQDGSAFEKMLESKFAP
ncbi:MAG: tyrosine-type recombinase/integrase [Desulfuromonadales bacterium]